VYGKKNESFMTIIVAGGSVKELWLTNEQWGWWAAKMLGTSQPTLRKLFENGGAPVYSWVKNKGTVNRELVIRVLDKRGINLTNYKMTYMGNPHDKMVDLLSVIAQATLPGAIMTEDPSIFQYLLIASGRMNVREERERQTRNHKGSKGKHDTDNRTQIYRPDLTLEDYRGEVHFL
jgi:hypothetical protein